MKLLLLLITNIQKFSSLLCWTIKLELKDDNILSYWTGQSKASINKQTKWTIETFKASFGFLNESYSLNETEELENIPEEFE